MDTCMNEISARKAGHCHYSNYSVSVHSTSELTDTNEIIPQTTMRRLYRSLDGNYLLPSSNLGLQVIWIINIYIKVHLF